MLSLRICLIVVFRTFTTLDKWNVGSQTSLPYFLFL